ncbi:Fe(3+)-siderophore ABC transporter permease [Rhodococcus sp. 05-340-1]|uniref:iron chelate uptake ABC transporter family permease subunit n=1 Tax=unclassified Rhodococcus (in: high G+C Gram-positive bacteria) TaxID=192944 RepID=UPI000B9C2BCF|nr:MULTISPECIES: iron chelate uptake ABC transporter family permease subunit [unclassified Rhodococcus (in: high G+C Gram-positive bacteria)]OZD71571.1 Fe(3+)-siderophore ABC transporter permease [Rhodococcus sp. 05-340-2]OZD74227.1 Fe(3+)-siderophore ABC transporter permease [Rhodococcus sp. 05-340-1]
MSTRTGDGPEQRDVPAEVGGLARTDARRAAGLFVVLGVLAALCLVSISVGTEYIPIGEVWHGLFVADGSTESVIVRELRLPRTVLGLLVGIALGVAGVLIQAMTRNPLADPGILGVNAGAAFFVAIAVGVLGVTDIRSYIWFAFAGAVVATIVVYALGSLGRAGATPIRLTLSGIALGAVLGGVTSGMLLLDPDAFDRMRFWGAGSLAGRGLDIASEVAPFIALGVFLAALIARPLNAIALGDDLAQSLGANVIRTRIVGVVAVTLLAGAATAAAGPIGFVGLMIPHMVRWFVGPDQRWILIYTVFAAPGLLLLSDVVGRIVIRPGELQVGIVTAFVGAPVLIVLVRRKKASGL